jgi:type VI secretion system protein ImpH
MRKNLYPFHFEENKEIKAEIQLATELKEGLPINEVIIQSLGVFRRTAAKDIEQITTIQSEKGNNEKIVMQLNRNGLYDLLPEGLFHQPSNRKAFKSTKETLEEIDDQRAKEASARKFFLPLEQEFFLSRLMIELEERKYFVSLGNISFNHIFRHFWGLFPELTAQQATNLMYLLPLAHAIAGNIEKTSACFESILGEPVSIQFGDALVIKANNATPATTKQVRLGDDFIMGDSYTELMRAAYITIGPISNSSLVDYLSGGKREKLLQLLLNNFVPFEWDLVMNFEIDKNQRSFSIAEDRSASRLGYNAFL